ncbi:acylase [Kordiimonas sp. SCSIO 12610]|uniref:acylase n=1 Tax=Kordiimonas sp. SCSIO 12610 TaxID=2829597 RepID=UPI00210E994C|nr:acylase [Kordiimonas sp. SCSIO 12610]UTW54576.1 acylase [Kordiimonas sp. SCSIO 12610]
MKKKLIVFAGLFFLLIIVSAMTYTWSPLPKNPSFETLAQASQNYDVEILRDNWGVPHIFGERDQDTVFGMGYVQAEDDFETVQESLAASRGVLARHRGFDAATIDYIVNLFSVWDIIKERYETDVTPEIKALAEAYAAGINLYAAEHPDQAWEGLFPITPQDLIAGGIFRTPFFYGLDGEIMPLFGDERVQEIALDPSENRVAYSPAARTLGERGSNAMAVAPKRSGDGKTRLVVNSHQPFSGPVAWYEAHLVSGEGLDIAGGTFPGSMFILHGFNRNLGWANTVNKPDLSDIYVLTRNPENDQEYLLDGEWVPFTKKTATIDVKLFGSFAFPAEREILFSKHGPVIESKHGTYAIRYAGQGEIRQFEQYYRYNKAKNLEEFKAALAMQALPSINYLYADKEGNIGFIHNGQYPDRIEGWEWRKYLPGDRSDLIWTDYKPFEEVPQIFNPASGFLYNSNNTPFSATDGPDNLKPDQFSPTMGLETHETNRSLRTRELSQSYAVIDEESLLAIKFDLKYAKNSIAAKVVNDLVAEDWSSDPVMTEAIDHLKAWDLSTDIENKHAALGVLTTLPKVTESYTRTPAPDNKTAFKNAVDLLKTNYGKLDPTWGEVNRIIRGKTDLPVDGAPDILRAIYPETIREDGKLHAFAGDTYIAIVEWDKEGELNAKVIHQFGSATKDQSSMHYDDQVPLFAEKKFRKMLMDRADIEANLERAYSPGK